MNFKPVFSSAALSFAASVSMASNANAAITVETTQFITSPTYDNNFSSIGATENFPSGTPFSQGGITVEYVGSAEIWTTAFPSAPGGYSWYENGGGTGYTDITLTGGGSFSAVQILVGSGWFGGTPDLEYQLLDGGSLVASGVAGPVPTYSDAGFSQYYGFTGGTFDEVQLQVQNPGTAFNPGAYEAGAYADIAIGNAVPEPATWAMMLVGFGGLGAAMRSRRKQIVTA
jgi:hypothetical protein